MNHPSQKKDFGALFYITCAHSFFSTYYRAKAFWGEEGMHGVQFFAE
jgi:hypothetical protein